jgi:NAD(P)-dependent dehydrogenase (short-subunit alcohol dehydrogenase family)
MTVTQPTKIIVTGAAQGIGRAVALRLAQAGVRLAIWDQQRDGLEETASFCRDAGAQVIARQVDVGVSDQIDAGFAAYNAEWGCPDALVNNAGIFPRSHAIDMALEEWDRVLRVNLTGTFLCARAAARLMRDTKSGVIVNMASGRALHGAANGAHYAASKGGIIALTKSLAQDWAADGIRVNCVIPGITDTAQPRGEMNDEQLMAAGRNTPMGRIGQPSEIAAVVAFLLSVDSSYMTGQSVAVNGGAIMIP